MSGKALLDHFSALDDPRQSGKVVYPLPEIMLLVLCATLAAAEDFVEIRRFGTEKLDFLRTMLPFARGIPSHDTLNDVLNALDPGLFSECFTTWVEALREAEPDIVAVDGKSSRRARAKGCHPLHVVSAWATRQRLVLGQEAVGEKTRERLDRARNRTGREYSLAMYERGLASLYCSEIFQKYDFILSPTVPMVAPRIAEIEGSADFARRYLSNLWWTNFVGCPAITIPAGVGSDGLPIGLQIVGRPDDDDNLLRIAAQAVKALS